MRLATPAMDPHGALLSAAADQTLSAGHMNPAGPKSSTAAAEAVRSAKPARIDLKTAMFADKEQVNRTVVLRGVNSGFHSSRK